MLVLVTGATSGIGKATAEIFAAHGHDVIITGRRTDRLEAIADKLQSDHKVRALPLTLDVRNHEEVKQAIGDLRDHWQRIDVLVNNAGLAAGLAPIQDGEVAHWERMIDTNVKGLLYLTRYVSQLMILNGKGHIVNIGSIAGKEVYANGNVYCATKHAVDALNKGMRIDLLPHNIKVTAINPGMVETEFSLVRFDGDADRAKKVYSGLRPLSAVDIAETIYWVTQRPAHVNINDLVIMPAAQASATNVSRH